MVHAVVSWWLALDDFGKGAVFVLPLFAVVAATMVWGE